MYICISRSGIWATHKNITKLNGCMQGKATEGERNVQAVSQTKESTLAKRANTMTRTMRVPIEICTAKLKLHMCVSHMCVRVHCILGPASPGNGIYKRRRQRKETRKMFSICHKLFSFNFFLLFSFFIHSLCQIVNF